MRPPANVAAQPHAWAIIPRVAVAATLALLLAWFRRAAARR
ncbi:MAG TPA: hypothetical protein VFO53_07810 [Casimicrobiaceae bacterium]|nr:hypothetical protein [Casimicrobiaceae bacterium]